MTARDAIVEHLIACEECGFERDGNGDFVMDAKGHAKYHYCAEGKRLNDVYVKAPPAEAEATLR